jgi:hypothetical protein
MSYFRRHRYRLGLVAAIIFTGILIIWHRDISELRLLLSISLITLFIHQFEEYQLPGYFPRMVNTAMFRFNQPDRFPLNTDIALLINAGLCWILYMLAIILGQHAVWLATATIVISAGNVIAHTILFNIKGKTFYNPGLLSSLVLFLTMTVYYFIFLSRHDPLRPATLTIGILLGLLVNYFGVTKLITILSDKNTVYIFKPFR